jgi:sugar phosphate isomerase/epimerase
MTGYLRAVSTIGCPDATLDQALTIAASNHLDGIELRTLESTTDLPALFAARFGTPDTLAKRLAAAKVRVVALGTSFRLGEPADGDFDALLAFAPWADAIGAKWLRVFDGRQREQSTRFHAVRWREWSAFRARKGWRCELMVETHDSLVTGSKVLAFLDHAPQAAILWDTHHTWRVGQEDPVVTWDAIHRHVVHIHVKDSVQTADTAGFRYVLPGAGLFPMTAIKPILQAEFRGFVSLEWERQWHPALPPLAAALEAAAHSKWW